MRPHLLLLVVFAIAGCAGSSAQRMGEDGLPARNVAQVKIEGNHAFSDDDLLEGLANRPPSGIWPFRDRTTYDALALELDRRRIEAYYRKRGFFSVKVDRVEVREQKTTVEVVITLTEGKPTRITAVEVTGAPADERVPADELGAVTGLRAGERFSYEKFALVQEAVRRRLVAAGYAYADVVAEAQVDRDRHTAKVIVRITPGPRVRFGKTKVEGLDRVPEGAVRRRIAWQEGEVFDPKKLDETQGALYRFDFFSVVRFEYDREKPSETVDITVQVTEKTRHEIRLGGGVGIDDAHYEIRGRIGYTHRNLFDPLTTLRVDLRPAYRFLRAEVGEQGFGGDASIALDRQDLFFHMLRGQAELTYTQVQLEAYTSRGPRLRLTLDRTFWNGRVLASGGWQVRYETFLRPDPVTAANAEVGITDPYRVAYYYQTLGLDLRDDSINAHKGLYLELRLEEAGPFAGSLFDYVKTTPEARVYVPAGDRFVLAARTRVGWLLSQSQALPITERFFAGGASSQRGFAQRRLAPSAPVGDGVYPVGGEASLESSVEGRLDVMKLAGSWLGIAVFLDGADVTRTLDDVDVGNLHWATGFGLRYASPIGPLRVDVGYRLNRKGTGEPDSGDSFAYHLTLGEAF